MIELHFPLQKIFHGAEKIVYSLDKQKSPLNLAPGYFYYFQGKNGVGKTTLLNIISFLTDFDGGVSFEKDKLVLRKVEKDKSNKVKSEIRKKHFSYVFQDPHIINIYSIRENLKIVNPLFDFHTDMQMIFQKINGLQIDKNEKLYIQTKLNKIIHEEKNSPFYLSGGEKQLLSFIRAMIKPSNIIFADEPWAAMDQLLKEFIEQELYKYLSGADIFAEIRDRVKIDHYREQNTVIAIAHIFHHSDDISIYGNLDKNFSYRVNIEKINSKIVDKNYLDLIRFSSK